MGIKGVMNQAVGCHTPPLNFFANKGQTVEFDSDVAFRVFHEQEGAGAYKPANDAAAAKIKTALASVPEAPPAAEPEKKGKGKGGE